MSLDVWFREDIKNALMAVNQANGAAAAQFAPYVEDLHDLQVYRAGYCDALRAVAIALGIAIPVTLPEPLTHSLRLTRNGKEVRDHDELSGA